MISIPGVDYAWSHPSPTSLKAAGKAFVCRYLATDASKSLTAAEAKALAAVGISSVVVWETTAKRALDGKGAGAADAKAAVAQATACGMPSSRPIYFAVDFDATAGQQTAISAYFDGAASVLGLDRVGIYGGYYPVKRTLDAGKATWAWQTVAWSGGKWDVRAVIRQGAQATIGGVSCDRNTALTADYGQWTPGEDMALSADDISKVAAAAAKAVLTLDGVIAAPADDPNVKTNAYWALQSYIKDTNARVRVTQATEAAQTAAITAMAAALGKVDAALDVPALVTEVKQAIDTGVSEALAGIDIHVTTS
jgi:hypothetical protein